MFKILLFALLFGPCLSAQDLVPEVLASTGGGGSVGGVQLNWTVGETLSTTLSNNNGSLTQGFHQGFLSLATLSEQAPFQLRLFPNPSSDWLYLQSDASQLWNWQLFSAAGQALAEGRFQQSGQIDLSRYPSGLYLLRVQDEQGAFNTYKVTFRH